VRAWEPFSKRDERWDGYDDVANIAHEVDDDGANIRRRLAAEKQCAAGPSERCVGEVTSQEGRVRADASGKRKRFRRSSRCDQDWARDFLLAWGLRSRSRWNSSQRSVR
jgi:hypothetical protein